MRKVKLSIEEKTWLSALLTGRIDYYSRERGVEKYMKAAKRSLQVISSEEIALLTPLESRLCTGCVNEILPGLFSKIEVDDASDLLYLSENQRTVLERIDMAKDILIKLGYDKRSPFPVLNYQVRFRDSLNAIDKLKNCERICLSHVNDNVYKIKFVFKKSEEFAWEMSHSLGLCDLKFYPAKSDSAKNNLKRYSAVTDRTNASGMLERTSCDWYPENVLKFFKAVLN